MPGKPEQSDWLDELYQADNSELPPESLDDAIRAAARQSHQSTPWYRHRRVLASAAALVLGLGVASMWWDAPDEMASVSMEPESITISTSAEDLAEAAADASPAPETGMFADQSVAPSAAQIASADAPASAKQSTAGNAATTSRQIERSERLVELRQSSSVQTLAERVKPEDCETATLIDAGDRTPYAVCHQRTQSLVHHADCPEPYALDQGTVSAAATPGALIVVAPQQRLQLSCNAASGDWVSEELPQPN